MKPAPPNSPTLRETREREAMPFSVRTLRQTRPLHRYLGIPLTLLVVLSSVTGVLLAWKKSSATLQPPTWEGQSTNLGDWREWSSVQDVAVQALASHLGRAPESLQVDRFDVRPRDGIVKVLFTEGSWEVQVDPTSLRAYSVARRHSDWIETVHDLSIISDLVKVITMNVLGFGLILLSATGLWLWYGPHWVRRHKNSSR